MNDSPLMTLYIISYNHERFIRDAVVSALNQDYKNLEIIISDDCSTDNTFKIIHETVAKYNGPHKIVLNRNKKNMGLVEHNNFIVLNLVNTQYFVVQAGDDISMPNRVTKISQYLQENSDVYALCSNAKIINKINEEGGLFISQEKFSEKKRDLNDIMNKGTQLFGAAAAYSKDLFSKFGGLKSNARNEDQILPFRAALLGKIGYIKEPLIKYRVHGNNLSFWVQMKEANYNEFIELEKKNFSNKIINLENFIEDILKINNDILKINIVRNKIEKLQLYKNLLSKNIFMRIYLLSRAMKLINKLNIVMLFSPRLYYFIIVRKLNK